MKLTRHDRSRSRAQVRRPSGQPAGRLALLRRTWPLLAAAAWGAATWHGDAHAQARISGDVVKIGFITDMSGLYADIDGAGGVEAIRMAIADMKGR